MVLEAPAPRQSSEKCISDLEGAPAHNWAAWGYPQPSKAELRPLLHFCANAYNHVTQNWTISGLFKRVQ